MRHRAAVLSEYGLLVALIAVAAVTAITFFGSSIGQFFQNLPCDIGIKKDCAAK